MTANLKTPRYRTVAPWDLAFALEACIDSRRCR